MSRIEFPPLIIGAMRLGSWGSNMSTNDMETFIKECIDLGFNTFDHADIYGDYSTENDFGKALNSSSSLRSQIHIITKCGIHKKCDNKPDFKINSYDSSKVHILNSVDKSLKNFNTDYIDTLLIHRPDYLMEPDEIALAIEMLKQSGKVLNFGVSNFSTYQFDLLNNSTELITNELELSLANSGALDDGTLNQCKLKGIRPMAWSPLGGGELMNGVTDLSKRILKVSDELCTYYDCELDQLLYAWIMKHPSNVIPVTGTSNLKRIESAKKAVLIKLENEHWYTLLEASRGESVP